MPLNESRPQATKDSAVGEVAQQDLLQTRFTPVDIYPDVHYWEDGNSMAQLDTLLKTPNMRYDGPQRPTLNIKGLDFDGVTIKALQSIPGHFLYGECQGRSKDIYAFLVKFGYFKKGVLPARVFAAGGWCGHRMPKPVLHPRRFCNQAGSRAFSAGLQVVPKQDGDGREVLHVVPLRGVQTLLPEAHPPQQLGNLARGADPEPAAGYAVALVPCRVDERGHSHPQASIDHEGHKSTGRVGKESTKIGG